MRSEPRMKGNEKSLSEPNWNHAQQTNKNKQKKKPRKDALHALYRHVINPALSQDGIQGSMRISVCVCVCLWTAALCSVCARAHDL